MSLSINKFPKGSDEYQRLEKAADILNGLSDDTRYVVKDVYFDFDQDWMWTTLIAYRNDGVSYQALTPAYQEKVLLCSEGNLENLCRWIHKQRL